MSESKNSIDVIVPAYNASKFILYTLDSINAQTHKPNRIIIVNDGSTDNTLELVENYKSIIPLKIVNKKNGGLPSARNAGIAASDAEFLAFVDSDDVWESEKIEKQLKRFQAPLYDNLGIVYCDYKVIDDEGNLIEVKHETLDPNIRGNILDLIIPGNKVSGSASAVLVRKSCVDDIGGFDEGLRVAEDWDYWLRLAAKYAFDYVPEKLLRIRRHGGSMQANELRMFTRELDFFNKWTVKLAKERQQDVKDWGYAIVRKIIGKIPDINYYLELERNLSSEAKLLLFPQTRGNILKYMIKVILVLIRDTAIEAIRIPFRIVLLGILLTRDFLVHFYRLAVLLYLLIKSKLRRII
jgi:glycosyltransferase involved in cell wall biosynthesis